VPQKTWVVGEEVLAADFNTYVQNQVVPRFASVAARDAAWPAATAGNGAVCTTTDTGTLWQVIGPSWTVVETRFGGGFDRVDRFTTTTPSIYQIKTVAVPTVAYASKLFITASFWAASDTSAIDCMFDVQRLSDAAISDRIGPLHAAATIQYVAATLAWEWDIAAGVSGNFALRANPTGFTGTAYLSATCHWHSYAR
jgi:hypothetical protein